MKRTFSTLALALLACAAVPAATLNTTLTVTNATLSPTSAFSGPVTLTNIGSGTLSAPVLPVDSAGNFSGAFTITLAGADRISGRLQIPSSALADALQGRTLTGCSATITGGAGAYSGATGSFPNLTGTAKLSGINYAVSFSGTGTITTGGTVGPVPTISQLQNNYSYILPGLPNYGIAPGSLFIIKGSGLNNQPISALQSSLSPGLPTLFNGTSISVTVNGTTTTPGIYYTSPTQLAAVLPSNTPVGKGTITVTNSGQASAPAQIQVVQSALGLDSYNGSGTGLAVAQDANFNLFGPTNSATPGQTIILWGSGTGADTSNDDKTFPMKQNNLTGIPMQVFIGGTQASIAYRGRSQYPGVDQLVVTIPLGVPTGCSVSILAVSGNVVSNSVSISVAADGGSCSDSNSVASVSQISALSGKSIVNVGSLGISQLNIAGTVIRSASASFLSYTGLDFRSSFPDGDPSIGSCAAGPSKLGSNRPGLDIGSVNVSGPAGTQPLSTVLGAGIYSADLPSGFIPANGASFIFNNGAGGRDVKGFSATLTYPTPLTWTNMNSISSVVRPNGLLITWSFGAPDTYVRITGASNANVGGQQLTVTFVCLAPVSAGQFTVPSAVLLALPAGTGGVSVQNFTNPQSFSATGLDLAYASALTLSSINVPFLDDASVSSSPDLVITSVTFPTSAVIGSTQTFTAVVRNSGTATAGAFRVGLYYSADSTITTGDTQVGICNVSSLAAGSSTTCSGPLPVPAALSAGAYWGGAIADDLNQVAESNESNNALATSSTVSVVAQASANFTGTFSGKATEVTNTSVTGSPGASGPMSLVLTQTGTSISGYGTTFYANDHAVIPVLVDGKVNGATLTLTLTGNTGSCPILFTHSVTAATNVSISGTYVKRGGCDDNTVTGTFTVSKQ